MKKHTFLACCSVLLFASAPAYAAKAPKWNTMPPACTPERAVPWIEGAHESAQAPCHCPPTSLCPQTYEEYSNPNTGKMPMRLVSQCCPVIEPDKCPEGTSLAGQKIPDDGVCDLRCPADTQLAGQKMPADGKCNPYESCPAKYYPTLSQVGINPTANIFSSVGHYRYGNGQTYEFGVNTTERAGNIAIHYGGVGSASQAIERYNFSIYVSDSSWSLENACDFYGKCPIRDFYGTTQDMWSPSTSTWFGYLATSIAKLGDNFMTSKMLEIWDGRDVLQIADYDVGNSGQFNTIQNFDELPELEASAPQFFEQCRAAAGEYVELDEITINGNRCQYLQCRYVREVTNTSCMTGETKITLADGTTKALKDVTIGEQVKGKDGVHKVTALNTYQSKLRVLYGINGSGAMITGDHPIRTTEGWKLITDDAAAQSADKPGFAKTKLAVGDVLVTDKGEVKVSEIKRFPSIQPVSTYNIQVDGNASFFANGFELRGFDKMEMKY